MIQAIYLAGHVAITIIAVAGVCLRLEHRLTKIETDLSWVKQRVQWEIESESLK